MKNACKPATKARANQRRLLFGSTAISLCVGLLTLAAVPVRADTTPSVLPQGGAVVAGQASIVASGQQLTINQSSARAIVNWHSFSVGQPNSVQFNQPNAQAATLNRVTGATPSTIAGEIRGNGQVYLVNPNGIAITSSGSVNAWGGFVGSTLSIADRDFIAGNLSFRGNGASASVSNGGRIAVGEGGFVGLVGGSVSNSGAIAVPLGKVGLGAGEQVTFDLNGNGFMQVAVPTAATTADGKALIDVSGSIDAGGGAIVVSAATVRSAIRNAVNIAGHLQVRSVTENNGVITLDGGDGGRVAVSGKLDATATATQGGTIIATGHAVELDGAAQIDASGLTGGTILIGGDAQGGTNPAALLLQMPVRTAETLIVGPGVTINADGLGGAGGDVVLWSDARTDFAGAISARGTGLGAAGSAEVSSRGVLDYTGRTDLRAENGSFGTLLLDPHNVIISAAAHGGSFTARGDNSIINVTTLENALTTANVTVFTGSTGSQQGNITVADALAWQSGGTLTLQAANNIAINAGINAAAGGLTLDAGGAISATGAISVARFTLQKGAWSQISPTLPNFMAADFRILGGSFLRAKGGDGSSGDPYAIVDVFGLQGIGSPDGMLAKNFILASDIDASLTQAWNEGLGFMPIGTDGHGEMLNDELGFSGTFDGQDHVISNLVIDQPWGYYIGLFGYVGPDGTIANVGMSGGSVLGLEIVGSLVGENRGLVRESYATSSVNGREYSSTLGGLVGRNYGTITQSYATGTVTGVSESLYVGGLTGMNMGTILQSYALGTVSTDVSSNYVGGLTGYNANVGLIMQSYATGAVTGGSHVGGLVGYNNSGPIAQSYWDITTSGQSSSAGGTGLTTEQFGDSDNFSGWTFDTTPGDPGWVLIDAAGGFNNRNISAGATRPMLLSEHSTTIRNAHQLQLIGLDPEAHYTLAANLDLAPELSSSASGIWRVASNAGTGGYGFMSIASGGATFTGSFDGQGHVLSNLVIVRPEGTASGLFGQVGEGGTIKNIGLVGGSISGGTDYTGGLVGINKGSVIQSYATLTVSGGKGVGGLVASNQGSITGSYATGAVSGPGGSFVGGLAGANEGSISQSYATGAVSGKYDVGGLVGYNNDNASITQSYALGDVTGTHGVGGLAGGNHGTISQTYATGKVTGSSIGGLVGYGDGTVTDSYWDLITSGQEESGDGIGLTTAEFNRASNFSGWTFGTAPASTGWVIVDTDGTLNNENGAEGATRPMLLSEYSTTITNANQLQLMAIALEADYTLAADIDLGPALSGSASGLWRIASNATASGYGFVPVGSDLAPFTGSLNGQGHNISNLVIDRPNGLLGLFGYIGSGGRVSDLGLVGGSVTSNNTGDYIYYTGGLAGFNEGSVAGVYATMAINGQRTVGGLIGFNAGSITRSYATGAVNLSVSQGGGLVGYNSGSITLSYASGNVSGGSTVGGLVGVNSSSIGQSYATGRAAGEANVGGLVGENYGDITQTYAVGYVDGGSSLGGLIGTQRSGRVTQSYWDMFTSGQHTNGQDDTMAGTGLTTAEMQNLSAFGTTYDGWDFISVWAPPNQVGQNHGSAAAYYPELYALSSVLVMDASSTRSYGEETTLISNYYGLRAGDFVTTLGTHTTAATASSDIGNYAVTLGGGVATSTAGNVYRYVAMPGSLTITPATLTYAADLTSRSYGSTNPLFSGGLTGFFGSDTLDNSTSGTLVFTSLAAAGSNVGAYAITGTGLSATTGNYNFVQASSNATALTINPLAVSLTGTRVYDATSDALSSILSASNLVSGDTLGLSGSGVLAAADAGGQALTSSGGALAGLTLANANYTLTGASGSVTITPATLTYTADLTSRGYGSANPLFSGSVTGFFGGDTLGNSTSGTLAFSSLATAGSNVGTYAITGTGLSATTGNYNFVQANGNATALTINPRAVSLTGTRVYDATTDALSSILSASNLISGDTLGFLGSGVLAAADVGTQALTSSGGALAGLTLDNANYTLIGASGSVTITPATLTYTADLTSRSYGSANPLFSGSVTGFFGSDTLDNTTSGTLLFSSLATAGSNVGAYGITGSGLSATNGNYNLVQASGNAIALTINPLAVSLTGTRVYDATTDALSSILRVSNLISGDTLGLSGSGVLAAADVGAQALASSGGALAGLTLDNANYTLTGASGSVTITPAETLPPSPKPGINLDAIEFPSPSNIIASPDFAPPLGFAVQDDKSTMCGSGSFSQAGASDGEIVIMAPASSSGGCGAS